MCLIVAGAACGGGDAGGQATGDPTAVSASKDASTLACMAGEKKNCTCDDDSVGRQTCANGKFGSCICSSPPQKPTTLATQDLCKAGYYKGGFEGTYKPGFAGAGIVPSGLEVMIAGMALNDIPALAFTLDEDDTGPAGEFHTYTVGGGCMVGSAQVFGVLDNPFVARISGSLDCGTGHFEGRLDGQYTLLNLDGVTYQFSGPLTAQFDLPSSLKDGVWMVAEPEAALGGAAGGGMGTWNADWASDYGPDGGADPCSVIPITDGGVPAASSPVSTIDAGT